MKALSVRQPYAWAIAHGRKDIENRSWATCYRGPLAIHAGARWDEGGAYDKRVLMALFDYGDRFDPPLRVERLGPKTVRLVCDRQLTPGAVVAVVDVVGICTARSTSEQCGCGVWAVEGQCHWRLANPRPLSAPVPCKGRLGLWGLPDEVEAAVLDQIAAVTS